MSVDRDITARKVQDAVTGLHTRTALLTSLDWRMRTAAKKAHNYAVLFVDVDGFKPLNDSLGHEAGTAF